MDMSPEENSRFNRLDKDDQLKLSAVMQMMAKEKDSIEKDARKAKGMMEDDSVDEMTGDTLNRLDGLVDQPLLISFLDKFEEIYYDFIEQGEEFEVGDVIAFLEKMLYDRAEDARMEDQLPDGFAEASGEIGVDQQGDTTRDVNVTDDTSMYDPLKEAKTQMKTIVSFLKKNKGASDDDIKDFIRTHKDDIKDMTMSEIEDEYSEYIAANSDSVDEGVEFFQKIGGIVPIKGGNLM
tara:strand:+ start:400 stop:1107 length:708 start_codon:yes stop_codon:yes gene_type:complete